MEPLKDLSNKQREKFMNKKMVLQKDLVDRYLADFDKQNEKEMEVDCAMCMNVMIESCLLPCTHRFCIQCIRKYLNTSVNRVCPLCRSEVPDCFKNKYYHVNIDFKF